MMFRYLRADEIDVRACRCSSSCAQLLLYVKTPAVASILDEAVGPLGWQKSYDLIDGQLFCTLSIWDDSKKAWVSRQDVGVPGSLEPEKSRASDAFKRAAASFGVARELATVPPVSIELTCSLRDGEYIIPSTIRLAVRDFAVVDGRVVKLSIENASTGLVMYQMDRTPSVAAPAPAPAVVHDDAEWLPFDGSDVVSDASVPSEQDDDTLPFDGSDLLDAPIGDSADLPETYRGVPRDTVARVSKIEMGATNNGMRYLKIEYSKRFASDTFTQFQPLSNKFGIAEAVKTLKGMRIVEDSDFDDASVDKLDGIRSAVYVVKQNPHFEYSVSVSKNSKGYDVYSVARID